MIIRAIRIRNIFVLIVLNLFASTFAFSQATSDLLCEPNTKNVYYINGVDNEEWDALEGTLSLTSALLADQKINEINADSAIKFHFIYNPTAGTFFDIIEAGWQLIVGGMANVASIWSPIDVLHSQLKDFSYEISRGGKPKIDNATLNAILVQAATLAKEKVTRPLSPDAINLISMTHGPHIIEKLEKGESVLIVAHSQGNLFANELINFVFSHVPSADAQARLKLINVAPATPNTNDNNKILYEGDLVVGMFAGSPNTFLPIGEVLDGQTNANFLNILENNKRSFGDLLGHNMVQVYLDNKISVNQNGESHRAVFVNKSRARLLELDHKKCPISVTVTGKCVVERITSSYPRVFSRYELTGTARSEKAGFIPSRPGDSVLWFTAREIKILSDGSRYSNLSWLQCGNWTGEFQGSCFRLSSEDPVTTNWGTFNTPPGTDFVNAANTSINSFGTPITIEIVAYDSSKDKELTHNNGVVLKTLTLPCN